MDREQERFRENLRKSYMKDLFTDSRLLSNAAIARNVDAEAVNKCRLSTFGQMGSLNRRMIYRTEDYEDMEKARDKKVDATKLADKADAREFGLDQYVEEMYFNYYGHGYDGGPVCDRPNAPWICPGCGLKVMMSMKLMKTECPICKHITPIGELKRDGVIKR